MERGWGIPRIKRNQTAAFGRQLIEWSKLDKNLQPGNIEQATRRLREFDVDIYFPSAGFDLATPVTLVPTALNEWVVRLPPVELVDNALEQIRTDGMYPVTELPSYFRAYPKRGKYYDEAFLFVRLADFTVTQCG